MFRCVGTFSFLFSFIFPLSVTWAAGNQCFTGSRGNLIFKRAIQNSDASLIKNFRADTGFKTTEGTVGCKQCTPTKSQNLTKQLTEIPKACVQVSLKRQVAQRSLECRRQANGDWKVKRRKAGSKDGPCFDDTTVDYIHYVTNKVVGCFDGLPMPSGAIESIDAKTLYSKINNESGFNFTYSYNGGVGAGQLTSSAVQEMNILNPNRTGGRIVPGRGRPILDAILNSKNPQCQALKPIIANDKKFKYTAPNAPNCEWVSLETGLARNLIYSIGYFAYLKNEDIGVELKKRAPKAYNDPELLNLLALIGYGPGGTAAAKTLIRTLEMGSGARSNSEIKQLLRKQTYLRATDGKMKEVKRMAGDTCRLL